MVAAAAPGAPAGAAAAVAELAAAVLALPCRIRSYDHALDEPELLRICKTVYGGTDYLPRVIGDYASRLDTFVLCAEADGAAEAAGGGGEAAAAEEGAGGGGGDGQEAAAQRRGPRLHGVVVGQERGGGALFLSGLRVCEDARGNGVGRRLMAAAEAHAAAARSAATLVSTTTPMQPASVAIFRRLGWRLGGTVECWPPYKVLHEFEAKIGWPETRAAFARHGSLLDGVPGASEALAAAALPEGSWRRCRDARELSAAARSVRRRQRRWWRERKGQAVDGSSSRSSGGAGGGGHGGSEEERDWLPWVYDVIVPAGAEAAEILAAVGGCSGGGDGGNGGENGDGGAAAAGVWLLPAGGAGAAAAAALSIGSSDDGGGDGGGDGPFGEYDVVLVLAPSKLFRRDAAAVLAARPEHVAPALALAAARTPHFMGFVDQGAAYTGPPGEGADRGAWPALYEETGAPPASNYYIFTKPLAAAGAAAGAPS